jgi:hypothetical protein
MKSSLGKHKFAALGLMVASALAMPFAASAHGYHGGYYHGGYHGYHGYHGGYYRGGHWEGGRWIAGALVAGAVIGLVDAAVNPAPVYYDRPVVYARPRTTVIYEDRPVVERRVVETRTVVYDDPYDTRYVRDDGYGGP